MSLRRHYSQGCRNYSDEKIVQGKVAKVLVEDSLGGCVLREEEMDDVLRETR
jgi:hypothetical protein